MYNFVSMKLELYEMIVNYDDELSGTDFIGFVEHPAHEKNKILKYSTQLNFNSEKRIITGVAIACDEPIYRNDKGHEYNVIFRANQIEIMRNKFFAKNFQNNVNDEHNRNDTFSGVTLVESYIVSEKDDTKARLPKAFKGMDIKDGSWIVSYHVTNDDVWEKAKKGKWNGFSIEIVADLKAVKFNSNNKKQIKMSKFWSKRKPKVFASAKTVDGMEYHFEGDLGEGTIIYSDAEMTTPVTGESVLLELSDGSFKLVNLDGDGKVTSVEDAESFESDEIDATVEEEIVAIVEEVIVDADPEATIEEVAIAIVNEVLDVIAEADEEQFASIKKFNKHKLLIALSDARKAKTATPKAKFNKPKRQGTPAPANDKTNSFADLRKAMLNNKNK